MPDPRLLELLVDATNKMVRTVDQLDAEELAAPSQLPSWSRAHVVAHLALNAEGLAGVLVGLREHRQVTMYSSQEDRDQDIEKLAAEEPTVLRERLLAGTTILGEEIAGLPDNLADTRIERTPGGRTFPASAIAGMRLREVEIHHVDLDAGYDRGAWPLEFSVYLVETIVGRADTSGPFTVHVVDADRSLEQGEGGPRVTGTAADLGWWLTGRGDGEGLTSEGGDLPRIGAW